MAIKRSITVHRTRRFQGGKMNFPRTRRPYRKKKKGLRVVKVVRPIQRLKGYVEQPFFRYCRCVDYTPIELKASNQIAPGIWSVVLQVKPANIDGFSTLSGIYREFRLKSVTVEYTPACRTDDYAKMFQNPLGSSSQTTYSWGGAALEMKFLKYEGYANLPATWTEALNRSGRIKKIATVRSFRSKFTPVIHNTIADMPSGIDPTRSLRAPWLSTLLPNNEQIDHFLSQEVYHTLNNISYDNAMPMKVARRLVYEIEFRGMKL